MGSTFAALKITNLFTKQNIEVNALVDSSATFMCVTEAMALQLGFDTTEVGRHLVTLADGR